MYLKKLLTSPGGLWRSCSTYKPIRRPAGKYSSTDKVQTKQENQVVATHGEFLDALRTQIRACGPMTVADYMRRVLTNPAAGYYMNHDVFGSRGDYITSPEINQIFGELISLWCFIEWEKVGSPSPVQLVELGPGRGTMIQDVLRVMTNRFDVSKNSLSIHLVEVSPYLAKAQAGLLCYTVSEGSSSEKFYLRGETVTGIPIFWYKHLEDVPREFSIILAHEFYDAMPIHKLQRMDNVWKEILVDVNDNPAAEEDQFRYVICQNETPMSKIIPKLLVSGEGRDHLEYSPEQQIITKEISQRLEANGGIALIMDYGHNDEKGDTFRSFKNHRLHSPLKDPGTADLTADVDFAQLKRHVQDEDKCITFGPITQRSFIQEMGGETRLKVCVTVM